MTPAEAIIAAIPSGSGSVACATWREALSRASEIPEADVSAFVAEVVRAHNVMPPKSHHRARARLAIKRLGRILGRLDLVAMGDRMHAADHALPSCDVCARFGVA